MWSGFVFWRLKMRFALPKLPCGVRDFSVIGTCCSSERVCIYLVCLTVEADQSLGLPHADNPNCPPTHATAVQHLVRSGSCSSSSVKAMTIVANRYQMLRRLSLQVLRTNRRKMVLFPLRMDRLNKIQPDKKGQKRSVIVHEQMEKL